MIKKILLSLGLIGLSLISFSSAECLINTLNLDGVYKNGYMHSSIGSNAFDIGITSKGTVISQSFGIGKNVFAFDDYHMFWWDINGNPYLYYSGTTQGYFQYYGVCDELTASSTGAVNCSKIAYDPENSKPLIQNFLSTTTVNDYYGYRYYKDGNNYHYYVHVCFSSHEIGKSLCFKYYRCTYNVDCRANNCNLTGSLGYSNLTFASIPASIIGQSPGLNGGNSGGGDVDPIPDNGFPNTNRGVFDSYAEQGFVLSRCYSDFSIDNLATATGGLQQFYETELDDGVYYTGATILDLFVEYGYGNSFDSFFDYWYQTYNQSLNTESPVKYVGLSKGLWNMSNKYYYAGLSNKYVDYTTFYNYCSYFVDFTGDWDAEYTGPQLPDDVSDGLSSSQSAIDYLSGFIHNQNSGNSQNFDANTFFTSLTTRFDRLLNNINGSFVGIIPGYILAIMMALIFIRIISH